MYVLEVSYKFCRLLFLVYFLEKIYKYGINNGRFAHFNLNEIDRKEGIFTVNRELEKAYVSNEFKQTTTGGD